MLLSYQSNLFGNIYYSLPYVAAMMSLHGKKDKRSRETYVVHPQDGKLEAFLRPLTKKGWWGYTYEEPSIFPFEEMQISADHPFVVEADGKMTKELRLKIKLAKDKIEMIVGRNRQF